MGERDRGYIEFKVDHEYSEKPEDKGFGKLLELSEERNPRLVGLLTELQRTQSKYKVIEKALSNEGMSWSNLNALAHDQDASYDLGQLIAYWDPKNPQANERRAEAFAKKLFKLL